MTPPQKNYKNNILITYLNRKRYMTKKLKNVEFSLPEDAKLLDDYPVFDPYKDHTKPSNFSEMFDSLKKPGEKDYTHNRAEEILAMIRARQNK